MASRRFNQFRYSLETAVVELFAMVNIGAAGAPTLASVSPASNQGIASISRLSAGKYRIVLSDPYVRVMGLDGGSLIASGIPAAPDMAIAADAASAASPHVDIQLSAAGVATDPANGEQLRLRITLKNSSIQ